MLLLRHVEERRHGTPCLVLGIMTGTSLDGVDMALVEMAPRASHAGASSAAPSWELRRVLRFDTLPYPPALLAAVRRILEAGPGASVAEVCRVNTQWAREIGAMVRGFLALAVPEGDARPVLIASHGQTLWHEGPEGTLQVGDTEVLAQCTGCCVVGNFRAADIGVGGCGAPLVPYFDRMVARMALQHFAVADGLVLLQNYGGIGNITVVRVAPDGGGVLVACDTGPGCAILNDAVSLFFASSDPLVRDRASAAELVAELNVLAAARQMPLLEDSAASWSHDVDGRISGLGDCDRALLASWLADEYFDAVRGGVPCAPIGRRSTGRERFGHVFTRAAVASRLEAATAAAAPGISPARVAAQVLADVCATAVALTVTSTLWTYQAIDATVHKDQKAGTPATWSAFISGGGARHPGIMRGLQDACRGVWPGMCVETLSSAVRIQGLPCTAADGASEWTLSDAKEALAFAVLGHMRLCVDGNDGTNEPAATGATRRVMLGHFSAP